MNKQEAIETIKNIDTLNIYDMIAGQKVDMVIKNQVLDLISQIDQPQKVVIPKFVADKIEYCQRASGYSLFHAMDYCFQYKDTADWLEANQSTFARAWLDGYEVEKEKLYIIPLEGLITTDGHQQYLTGKVGRYFASRRNSSLKQTFTQTELDNNVPACYREWAEPVEAEE